jgi:hypothetical protein
MQTLPDVRRSAAMLGVACLSVLALVAIAEGGQRGPGAPAGAAGSAKTAAPVDLTGYWVSLVTEDWIERMSPDSPPSGTGGGGGGFGGGAGGGGGRGRGAAPAAAAPTSTDPCRVYGAGGSMRVPGRLNITWADDNTLKVDMDAGTQTRLLHFNQAPAPAQRTLQGYSVATWETGARAGGFGGGGGGGRGGAPAAPRWGELKVVTTNTTGGYLLSSRNTYTENAVITEYFAAHSDFGTDYLTVVTSIEDGAGNPRIVSSTFKKEPNGSKFKPSGCEVVR